MWARISAGGLVEACYRGGGRPGEPIYDRRSVILSSSVSAVVKGIAMKTAAIILAGAIAFDLGVVVVAARAEESPKGPVAGTAGPAVTVRKAGDKPVEYLKMKMTDILVSSYAIDSVNTAKGCQDKMGKVVSVAGVATCQLPTNR